MQLNASTVAASDMVSHIAAIDIVASARLEADNWTGKRPTDIFNMLEIDGQWKVMNKVSICKPKRVDGCTIVQ